MKTSVIVNIGRKKITVQGKPVLETPTRYRTHEVPPAIPVLLKTFKQLADGRASHDRTLAIAADQGAPFRLLRWTFSAAEQSGLQLTSLVIRRNSDGLLGSVPVAIARPSSHADPHGLGLVVAISYSGYILASRPAGVMVGPDGKQPTIKCSSPLQQSRCPVFIHTPTGGQPANRSAERFWVDKYDYKRLADLSTRIKRQYPTEREVTLTADQLIPYRVVVNTIDALRGNQPECLEYENGATGQSAAVCRKDMCRAQHGCRFDHVMLVSERE